MIIVIFFSHISAISFLVLLVYLFARWFSSSRSYLILGYTFAFAMIIGTLIVSLTYLTIQLSYRNEQVNLDSIKTTVINYSNYGAKLVTLGSLYTYLSIISFTSIWVLSVVLLRTYSARIGRITYWTLVSIPIVFFLFPIISNKLGILDVLFLEYGQNFVLLYYIIFAPYQQIGGLMFGIVFWVAAARIQRINLKILVNIAGVGIVLLFSSSVLHGLTYIVSPPFGLVTVSYIGLAAYMYRCRNI